MRAVSAHLLLLLASTCGWLCSDAARIAVPKSDNNFGIHGGHPVNITEVPYMAQFKKKGVKWGCGACIVHEQFLVSAAHCGSHQGLWVTVGSDKVEEGENYEIEKVFKHPKHKGLDYDISVIKLKKKLKLSDRVQPIKMADLNLIPKPGDLLETSGFGKTEKGELSEQLLRVKVPYFDREKCREMFNNKVSNRMICAGGDLGKDSCNGDSGGPLVYKDVLIGVVSWGKKCGLKGFPGVYSYVPSMRDFIDGVIKNYS